jgi:UDP-2,4-diacetamido-2,4,6-trideoxy-beta-L-altropyranose hydrolase
MTSAERLFVRVDATVETGLGHFNRCLALAQRWREAHGPVTFAGRYDDGIDAKLAREHIDVAPLPAIHPDPADLPAALDRIAAPATVVLDGYHFDDTYQSAIAKHRRVLVVDDLGHLPRYVGTWLLNSSANAEEIRYPDAPPARLLGLRYALLRREIVAARSAPRRPAGRIECLLVTLGGADAANDTLRILQALIESGCAPPRVRVAIGPLNPHAAGLAAFAGAHTGIELVRDPPSMSDELLRADFVIASAGTISVELVYLGIPALLLAVVDNQLGVGPTLARLGAIIYGGDSRKLDARGLGHAVRAALTDDVRHAAIRRTAPGLVDGLGAMRICNILSGVTNV